MNITIKKKNIASPKNKKDKPITTNPDIINAITGIINGYNNANAADAKSRAAD